MRRRFLRPLLSMLVLALVLVTSPSLLACEHWECQIFPDDGFCWARYGPGSNQYPYAMDCIVKSDCMGGSCGYWCEYRTPCFDV